MGRIAGILFLIALFLAAPFAKQYAKGEEATDKYVPKLELHDHRPLTTYMLRYLQLRDSGAMLVIDGPCESACTLFMGYIPSYRVCYTDQAKMGFHLSNHIEGTMCPEPPPGERVD